MNFKPLACQNLRDYRLVKAGVESLQARLSELDGKIGEISIVSNPNYGGVHGPARTSQEEALLMMQDEYAALKPVLKYKTAEIKRVEKALAELTEEQQLILSRFHIDRKHNRVELLSDELHIQRSQVYSLHEEALTCFIKAMYAMVNG